MTCIFQAWAGLEMMSHGVHKIWNTCHAVMHAVSICLFSKQA